MSRKKEIEERLAAIATEAETEGADLEALNKEVDELTQERSAIIEKEEKRQSILSRIAEGTAGKQSNIAMPKMKYTGTADAIPRWISAAMLNPYIAVQ